MPFNVGYFKVIRCCTDFTAMVTCKGNKHTFFSVGCTEVIKCCCTNLTALVIDYLLSDGAQNSDLLSW